MSERKGWGRQEDKEPESGARGRKRASERKGRGKARGQPMAGKEGK